MVMGIAWESFSRISHVQLDPKEINRVLDRLERLGYKLIWTREPFKGEEMGWKVFLRETATQFFAAFSMGGKCKVVWCFLDGRDNDDGLIPGKRAYAVMAKYYKAPRFSAEYCHKIIDGKPNWEVLSSSPLVWSNKDFEGRRVDAVCYDVNGAYGWALEKPIPDTSKGFERDRMLKDGEIGFIVDGSVPSIGFGKRLRMVESGYANFAFPSMPSPYLPFVDRWYKVKRKARKKSDRVLAKNVINESIGYLQLVNPFIRATVVERCNNRMRALMDGDTIYMNTDSICSARPRDLKVTKEMGDFKIEHQGEVAIRGSCYQWGMDLPTYRGVPKKWFREFAERNGRPWDILSDPVPGDGNDWGFDFIERRLKEL